MDHSSVTTTAQPGSGGELMAAEIAEQPDVLRRLAERGEAAVDAAVRLVRDRRPRMVLLAARGSSDHAALFLKYLVETRLGLPAGLCSPSSRTFYGADPWGPETLVVALSQSGGSPDLISTLGAARAAGAPTVTITNTADSPLAGCAAAVVDLGAGLERSVAATKTYTSELLAAHLLVRACAGAPAPDPDLLYDAAAAVLGPALAAAPAIAAELAPVHHVVTTGRGFAYPNALEAALKLIETSYLPALAYSAADLQHGPFAVLSASTPAVVLTPAGCTSGSMGAVLDLIVARAVPVLQVGPTRSPGATWHLPTPHELDDDLAPVVDVIGLQVLALSLSRARGLDADQPRSLAKVTRTL